ncbi:MAG: type I-C CRISPR-associated protein Cas8c/Csd1 [Gallionellales bacterium RIFCSPLOWO2_02_FULL_57_47]|nr:MAG: type I-C CRISPR-associated protein Cas8c/Csd1 [Gallionellales bacterium RIFCSPLOWO2_02_FULL_57_47]
MILQALNAYYQRKTRLPDSDLAPPGFERKAVTYLVILTAAGDFAALQDTREGEGKKRAAKTFLLPQAAKKSVNVAANLLWGNSEYVFGVANPEKQAEKLAHATNEKKKEKIIQRLQDQHHAFVAAISESFAEVEDAGIKAVLAFLKQGNFGNIFTHPIWPEILERGANLTFRLEGDNCPVCEREAVVKALTYSNHGDEAETGLCLVSGETDVIERLHPSIQGVWGAQPSGAKLVSFQKDSGYDSYGKSQGANAPVGKRAAFAYTTALNHLLAKGSRQRIQVGDASTVFWAEKPGHPMEELFPGFFSEPAKDDPDQGTQKIAAWLSAPKTGANNFEDDGTRFYVLGLAPNAARIAIRFWHVKTVGELAINIRNHFDGLEIDRSEFDARSLSLSAILKSISRRKSDGSYDTPPNMAGDTMRAILTGRPYPATLLQAAIRRIRAEQEVNYPRAAIIKACINRYSGKEELKVSLDESNTNTAYRLGRLFAVLERIQEEANPGIRATIRNTFWGAASGTPGKIFPLLINLATKHLAKIRREKPGRAVNLEKLISSIMDALNPDKPFMPIFSLNDQGCFAVGYYHQKQHPSTYKTEGDEHEPE